MLQALLARADLKCECILRAQLARADGMLGAQVARAECMLLARFAHSVESLTV